MTACHVFFPFISQADFMFLKDSASLSVLMMLLLQSTVAGESAMTQGLKLSSCSGSIWKQGGAQHP